MEYVLGPTIREQRGGCLVRLADDLRKCVVFYGSERLRKGEEEIDPWGTGFVVKTRDNGQTYLITAAHIVHPLQHCPFSIRYNERGTGKGRFEPVDSATWFFHPTDDTVDVAVLEINVPEWADCVPYDQFGILETDRLEKKDFGPGDMVYTVGVWKLLYGLKKNLPFVHVGHIGLMPEDERVPVDGWLKKHGGRTLVEAYLTEGEPLNGASGSPVFVRRSLLHAKGTPQQLEKWIHGSIWLLGLHSNSWFGKPGEDYDMAKEGGDKIIPRGINVVVPSMKINEVLNQSILKAKRDAQVEAEESARTATKTGLRSSDANPTHREDFTRLLGAAARTPPQED
jgi:hypothetical protein